LKDKLVGWTLDVLSRGCLLLHGGFPFTSKVKRVIFNIHRSESVRVVQRKRIDGKIYAKGSSRFRAVTVGLPLESSELRARWSTAAS